MEEFRDSAETQGLKETDLSEELEALRLRYGRASRGFGCLESLTCWQAMISTAFDIAASISAVYFSFSAMPSADANGLKEKEMSQELEALRLRYGRASRGFGCLESLTCWQAMISTAFDIAASISAFYFSFSAMLSGDSFSLSRACCLACYVYIAASRVCDNSNVPTDLEFDKSFAISVQECS
ncbi:unnamed protein product, partial [Darwinula stevensoni]